MEGRLLAILIFTVRLVRLSFVVRSALNVRLKGLLESIKGHILLLLFLLSLAGFPLLDLDLIDNVQSASIVSLQVRPSQLENSALLLDLLEERVGDLADYVPLHDSFQMMRYFFT